MPHRKARRRKLSCSLGTVRQKELETAADWGSTARVGDRPTGIAQIFQQFQTGVRGRIALPKPRQAGVDNWVS